MVELWGSDLGQKLTSFHPVADVRRTLVDVTAGAGKDVGRGECLGRRRQRNADCLSSVAHLGDTHGGHEIPVMPRRLQGVAGFGVRTPPANGDRADGDEHDDDSQVGGAPSDLGCASVTWCRGGRDHPELLFLGHHTVLSKTPCSAFPSLPLRSIANRYGTRRRVVGVANSSPPMTARASAAFCSSPAPPMAMGIMPTTMAAAVISTGRIRVWPASIAASCADLPASCCSRAKVTSRMEFAEATPTAMIAPIREGTLRVVPVTNSIVRIPHSVAGSARMTTNGSPKFW